MAEKWHLSVNYRPAGAVLSPAASPLISALLFIITMPVKIVVSLCSCNVSVSHLTDHDLIGNLTGIQKNGCVGLPKLMETPGLDPEILLYYKLR